jgi:hypothetical protein
VHDDVNVYVDLHVFVDEVMIGWLLAAEPRGRRRIQAGEAALPWTLRLRLQAASHKAQAKLAWTPILTARSTGLDP